MAEADSTRRTGPPRPRGSGLEKALPLPFVRASAAHRRSRLERPGRKGSRPRAHQTAGAHSDTFRPGREPRTLRSLSMILLTSKSPEPVPEAAAMTCSHGSECGSQSCSRGEKERASAEPARLRFAMGPWPRSTPGLRPRQERGDASRGHACAAASFLPGRVRGRACEGGGEPAAEAARHLNLCSWSRLHPGHKLHNGAACFSGRTRRCVWPARGRWKGAQRAVDCASGFGSARELNTRTSKDRADGNDETRSEAAWHTESGEWGERAARYGHNALSACGSAGRGRTCRSGRPSCSGWSRPGRGGSRRWP